MATWGLVGDSSLYCKRDKRRVNLDGSIYHRLPQGVKHCHVLPLANKGLRQIADKIWAGPYYDTLGISYFGNDIMDKISAAHESHLEDLIEVVRLKATTTVFVVGGFSQRLGKSVQTCLGSDVRHSRCISGHPGSTVAPAWTSTSSMTKTSRGLGGSIVALRSIQDVRTLPQAAPKAGRIRGHVREGRGGAV